MLFSILFSRGFLLSPNDGEGAPAGGAPAPTEAAPAAPAAVPPAPAPPAPGEPAWLPDRLNRAAKTREADLLKELGVTTLDEAKAALAAFKTAEQARVAEEAQRADAAFTALTPAQQQAVHAIAGEDRAKRLTAIASLKPTWGQAEVPAPAPTVAAPVAPAVAPAAPLPPPANSAASTGAPPAPAAVNVVDANIKATFENLHKTNPFRAAAYYEQNQAAIARASAANR